MKKLTYLFTFLLLLGAVQAADEYCWIFTGGISCIAPEYVSGPAGTFYFANNNTSGSGSDGNNYTTSIAFTRVANTVTLTNNRNGASALTAAFTDANDTARVDSLNATRAVAGACTGGNSTHANVTNSTSATSAPTCIMVARDPGTGGSGTVTSVATGNGLTGGPITTTGTISTNATTSGTGNYSYWNGSAWLTRADQDTTYTNGTGLLLTTTTFSADIPYFASLFYNITNPFGFYNSTTLPADLNNYTTSASFTGRVLTLARNGMASLTASLVDDSILLNWLNITGRPTDLANFTNTPGYLTSAPNINVTGFGGNGANIVQLNTSDGIIRNATVIIPNVNYTAGNGLSLSGTVFSRNDTYYGTQNITSTVFANAFQLPNGQKIKSNSTLFWIEQSNGTILMQQNSSCTTLFSPNGATSLGACN